MTRLIATTALALVLAAPGLTLAQTQTNDATQATPPAAESTDKSTEKDLTKKVQTEADKTGAVSQSDATNITDSENRIYMKAAADADIFGTDFIGMPIYVVKQDYATNDAIERTAMDDWSEIGEISDVVLSRDGQLKAILADVGGFLGIGEKTVAIEMDDLRFVTPVDDDDLFLVVKSDRKALENAPEFDRDAMEDQTAANDASSESVAKSAETSAMTAADEARDTTATTAQSASETAADAADSAEKSAENAAEATEEAAEKSAQAVDSATEKTGETLSGAATGAAAGAAAGSSTVTAEGFTEIELSTVEASRLDGVDVYDARSEDIGEVVSLYDEAGNAPAIVIDVGGFLGLGEHRVAPPLDMVHILQSQDDPDDLRVVVAATKEELEAMPAYEAK